MVYKDTIYHKYRMTRKKVAFVIVGQIRENSLGFCANPFEEILESHRKHIFSDKFKKRYPDYDVYIVVDNVDEQKCRDFFGQHLKGVVSMDTGNYDMPRISYSYYNTGCYNASMSYFRAKIAWQMVEQSGIQYDYIFKMRPDVVLFNDTFPCFKALDELQQRQLYFIWDICSVGRYEIMKYYCNLFDNLTITTKHNFEFENNGLMSNNIYYSIDWEWQTIEIQVCENIMKYVVDNNMKIDEALKDSRIDFTCSRRNFTHHKNNKFPLDYYETHPDYKTFKDELCSSVNDKSSSIV